MKFRQVANYKIEEEATAFPCQTIKCIIDMPGIQDVNTRRIALEIDNEADWPWMRSFAKRYKRREAFVTWYIEVPEE